MLSLWCILLAFLHCKWNATLQLRLIGQIQFKKFSTGTEMPFGKATCGTHVAACQGMWTPRQQYKTILLIESVTLQNTWMSVKSRRTNRLGWASWLFSDCTLRMLTWSLSWFQLKQSYFLHIFIYFITVSDVMLYFGCRRRKQCW